MNNRFFTAPTALLLASLCFACAGPIKTGDTGLGKVLTNDSGMTLYTFDKDTDGVSKCVDGCAKNWPPFSAAADSKAEGDYSVIKRPDGSSQWAFKGKPLYTWSKDSKPGDTTGDGFKDVWHAAKL